MTFRRFCQVFLTIFALTVATGAPTSAQGLGGAGTVQGTVKDPTGGIMQSVTVTITNPVSGFKRDATTDEMGRFIFRNLPPNPYHLSVSAQGFEPLAQDVDVRSAVPITVDLTLKLAGAVQTVQVVGHQDILEADPSAHTDVDQTLVDKLPVEAMGGLNQVVTMASPGVVADSNGFFHPVGDHAQTQFSIDNQPITDQQSRIYSNQISPDAVQSMEIITGVPQAEYGDKSSLVVHIITKSGLDSKPTGTFNAGYGSFKTPQSDFSIGAGSHRAGDFLSVSGLRTDRLLDPPEFQAIHDHGTQVSLFNRFDMQPSANNSFHLNLQLARSAFDVPNTLDAPDADQHQTINTFNIAPGYTRVIGSASLLTANVYVRRDHIVYTPSADPFADPSGTAGQDRTLRNTGAKVDFEVNKASNDFKVGGTIDATRLGEAFSLGLTDPTLNSPCVDSDGNPSDNTGLVRTSQCAGARLVPNPDFLPGVLALDLTRGGTLFNYAANATIKTQAFYVQDNVKAGNATFMLGLRADHYNGLSTATLVEPRLGVSFNIPGGGTVLRASYGRTLETPYNENLLLSSGYNLNGLFGEGEPVAPGKRNEIETGIQQAFGRWIVADFGYFNKRTDNGYDFSPLFNTPIVFPVAWAHSKLNGFTGRLNVVEHKGFTAFIVMAHTSAVYSPPGVGGILLEQPEGDFRIDHDQKFNSTTNLQYTFSQAVGAWAALSWRYDSGLVAGSVPDYATALTLTGDQQAMIGLFCGSTVATPDSPITSCSASNRGATRLVIPADGAEDDVTNPPRIAPRHIFDLGFGADNVLHTSRTKLRVRFSVVNLTNKEALYNFLSTFSGTHFYTPRAYQVQFGVTF